MSARIGVAMIGHGFMGAAHSQAYRVAPHFFPLPVQPSMSVLVGRDPATTSAAAQQHGWESWSTDWREVLERDDIGLVDIVTPGDMHEEIAVAALKAGKHVLCEKPLANSVGAAERMAQAATEAAAEGVFSMVGFTYRRVPGLAFVRQLIQEGALGTIRRVDARYLQDWLIDPQSPMTWRLSRQSAGSGSLGDLGAHLVDIAQFLTGASVKRVSGSLTTFVTERPRAIGTRGLGGGAASSVTTKVDVDDAAWFTAEFAGGAIGSFEATRYATGRKNGLRIEISGERGALAFDLERLNEVEYYDATRAQDRLGFRRILVTEPVHPYLDAWWPTGHGLGYEHAFTHQLSDFLTAISAGKPPEPSFVEGLHVQRVLDAVVRSDEAGSMWTAV